jgi:hypothetical protein
MREREREKKERNENWVVSGRQAGRQAPLLS